MNQKPKIKAWINQLESVYVRNNNARILYYVKHNPYCTIREISDRAGIAYTTVGARVSDFMDEGIIEASGQTNDKRFTLLKFQGDSEKQQQNAKARKQEKMQQWIQRGIRLFYDELPESLKEELELLTL